MSVQTIKSERIISPREQEQFARVQNVSFAYALDVIDHASKIALAIETEPMVAVDDAIFAQAQDLALFADASQFSTIERDIAAAYERFFR